MRPECVVPENQCAMKRKEKKAQRDNKTPVTTTTVDDHMPPIMQCDPPPPEAARIVSSLYKIIKIFYVSDAVLWKTQVFHSFNEKIMNQWLNIGVAK